MPMPGMFYDIIQIFASTLFTALYFMAISIQNLGSVMNRYPLHIMSMDLENFIPLEVSKAEKNKKCKCLLTSEKIRHVLNKFPSAQPIPSNAMLVPKCGYLSDNVCKDCIATNCLCQPVPQFPANKLELETETLNAEPGNSSGRTRSVASKGRAWGLVGEMVQILQLMVVGTALALYYVIYGWMQFIYTALRVALYFRQADRPMKITLGVVAVTSLVVGLNVLLRIWKLYISIIR